MKYIIETRKPKVGEQYKNYDGNNNGQIMIADYLDSVGIERDVIISKISPTDFSDVLLILELDKQEAKIMEYMCKDNTADKVRAEVIMNNLQSAINILKSISVKSEVVDVDAQAYPDSHILYTFPRECTNKYGDDMMSTGEFKTPVEGEWYMDLHDHTVRQAHAGMTTKHGIYKIKD